MSRRNNTTTTSTSGCPSSSLLPLVWVRIGNNGTQEQAAAFLIEDNIEDCLIQWKSSMKVEEIKADQVVRMEDKPATSPPHPPLIPEPCQRRRKSPMTNDCLNETGQILKRQRKAETTGKAVFSLTRLDKSAIKTRSKTEAARVECNASRRRSFSDDDSSSNDEIEFVWTSTTTSTTTTTTTCTGSKSGEQSSMIENFGQGTEGYIMQSSHLTTVSKAKKKFDEEQAPSSSPCKNKICKTMTEASLSVALSTTAASSSSSNGNNDDPVINMDVVDNASQVSECIASAAACRGTAAVPRPNVVASGKSPNGSSADDNTNNRQGEHHAEATTTTTVSTAAAAVPQKIGFPLISSAYLQNMAEIAHIVTQDGRWRVRRHGGEGEETEKSSSSTSSLLSEPLLRWEDGVDLSAVTYLSRCYIPPATHTRRRGRRRQMPCKCLLCHDNGSPINATADGAFDDPDAASSHYDEPESVEDWELPPDEDVRWLYLFCRLFYRKGPWFRLDDIYERYYKQQEKEKGAAHQLVDEDDRIESDQSKSLPHVPSKENQGPMESSNTASRGFRKDRPVCLNDCIMQTQISAFTDMVSDLSHLIVSGLGRAFRDEEECGKTVGVSLLTADMRAVILSKLGGGRKKQPQPPLSGLQHLPTNNAIWRQMSQQQSIFASFGGGGSKLLPVRKHVDEVILEKIVLDMLKTACELDPSEFLPTFIYKQHAGRLKQKLFTILIQHGETHHSCFRLREEPHIALLRCCRLFLCATCGPGDMRSDEANGWKSLQENSGTPPLQKRIRRPGIDSWCFVSFPGLLTRFGRMSTLFAEAYYEVDPTDNHSSRLQIFSSRDSFLAWECVVELRANVDYLLQLTELVRYEMRRRERDNGTRSKADFLGDSVDYLRLLTKDGRASIAERLLGLETCASSDVCASIFDAIDAIENTATTEMREWEKILVAAAALSMYVLKVRNETISGGDLQRLEYRPWLRHLCWEGCLAYILWDLIPILERFDLYDSAVMALQILIFGSTSSAELSNKETTRLAPWLISRRARGKAYDRLVIDLNHISKFESSEKSVKAKKLAAQVRLASHASFCERVIGSVVQSASIPFSAIRSLARRLKRPLVTTMGSFFSLEAQELGLRLGNSEAVRDESAPKKGYSDWTPITDFALANNVLGPDASVGTRCVFVGHDDGSLNVEELALECYHTGKLPVPDDYQQSTLAGWEGWHDEGGHIRALFRIICGGPMLNMDWVSCLHDESIDSFAAQHELVHLSPYQGAPFDLHVGFELSNSTETCMKETKGFYARRRDRIEKFLQKISRLSRQGVCDLVFNSVAARLEYVVFDAKKDPGLERDLQNVRTLSLVAAGCGGEQLAAIFRCLFFDYRHWSGGLPDLTLVRALATDSDGKPTGLVDLSSWIGESFSTDFQLQLRNQEAASMLADEEFLACNKVGDSGSTQTWKSRRGLQVRSPPPTAKVYTMADLPQKLDLFHNGTYVLPETMLVEVKSSNDRLDPRQEDWLNVLDRYGNARVCKFEDSAQHKRRNGTGSQKGIKKDS